MNLRIAFAIGRAAWSAASSGASLVSEQLLTKNRSFDYSGQSTANPF